MLKKAGIIVAASVAGMLALSPLAFATEGGHDNGGDRGHSDNRGDKEQGHGDSIDYSVDYSDESGRNCNAGVINSGDATGAPRSSGREVVPAPPSLLGLLEISNFSPLSCNYDNDVDLRVINLDHHRS